MLRETVELVNGRVEVAIFEEFICLDVYGEYTDADVMRMKLYLDDIFQKAEKALTRILDATHVDEFMLTPHGTDMFGHWADKIKKMWPGSRAFLIADKQLSYGMSRM